MLATLEVQKAIYEKLTSYGLAVHSTLPINTKLPYVQFTNITIEDESNKSNERQAYTISLNVWCVDTTSINIHSMTKQVLDVLEEELDLGEEYSHDKTDLALITMLQDEVNSEIINQAVVELVIEVSKN